jgi:hypothetical protein
MHYVKSHAREHLLMTTVCLSPLLTGCAENSFDEEPLEPRMVTVCGEEMEATEFAEFLDGNLVIVAALAKDGSSKSRAIADLALMLAINGIDFSNLDSAHADFEDGRYSLNTGESKLGFELYFAGDFGAWSTGDIVPHNVFALASYARNIEARLDSTGVVVTYDPGPLHDLVQGEIEFDGNSLSARVRVRGDLLDIEIDSGSRYTGVWESSDDLWLQMTTTRINVAGLAGDLEDAGFGFSYDATHYRAPTSGLEQRFHDSEFLTVRLDNGNYNWQGDYRAWIEKGGHRMHQSGWATNQGGNYTEYYCDDVLTHRVGTAEHDDSLGGGVFVFEDGTRFRYGLR